MVLAAGAGKRMRAGKNKQFLQVGNKPLLVHTLENFINDRACTNVLVVINEADEHLMREMLLEHSLLEHVQFVYGGAERQHSVYEGLKRCSDDSIVFIHDGARPFVKEDRIEELALRASESGAALLAVKVTDTIKQQGQSLKTLDRSTLWAAQTPQAFRHEVISRAHEWARTTNYLGTDDASLVEALGEPVEIVEGSYDNIKLTTPEDVEKAMAILQKRRGSVKKGDGSHMRIGQGFDVHQLVEGRPCIMGGVEIPHDKGLLGHSDADVLLHTVADAILGALGEGDIGKHFPDTDPEYKDADSIELLKHVYSLAKEQKYAIGNLDCTIIAEAPKMGPHIEEMRNNLARILETEPSQINVKATTTEKLGFPGRQEGIAAQAVVLLTRG
ncbi:2-C-methyl-D-erythritol 2,4-cyclodiphosphate synthase [Pontibacillus halophilus JSM 076056 = DSM 19796]|uniref:Bifunctional enzyme IspD/IspF n=1 Tax=Pontibacillus halophilus JSM 076056 = DSM 19796 TaxID=1385510 RepID=A0A0A5I3K8_9BACI|nr:2-C-methyl-D-erythritol 2,4-cyclodiphosphate synthase [Pontibacillus halophilus JSM 076056 = DSM 19796]